ncbi:MAG: type I restriction-modification system subunit M [Thiobacillus sp.]|nr:type I restriction-modification system subunit M [Thiobacillus sp.]
MTFTELANFIWSVADDLRGDYRQSDYGKIILPFALLRRLDCVLEPTKDAVLAEYAKRKDQAVDLDVFLKRKSKQAFYNTSEFTFASLLDDQKHIRQNLVKYIGDFSEDARDVFERFKFIDRVAELDDKNLLFILVKKFAAIDMHPDVVPNESMGLAFEELIRKFAEASNETAGEHFTPREVIRLMVMLLFAGDDNALSKPGAVRSLYDPTAGTGGMLSVGEHVIASLNPSARLRLYGQELNDESYAICKADMLIKGQDPNNIHRGNTLAEDKLASLVFDYALSNPPFGVDWKKVYDIVKAEYEKKGFAGRFGPGLPRVSDGSMLFLLHLISKMRPASEGGSRIGIVLNGSPLFTGGAGSGESEIRRYLLEHDLVEAIVGLPTDLFFNTGIATYVWIISNRKGKDRKGKVQLIDASGFWQKMRKSLGSKRKEMSEEHIAEVLRLYSDAGEARLATVFDAAGKEISHQILKPGDKAPVAPKGGKVKAVPVSRIFSNEEFGYQTITVERPLRDEAGKIVIGDKGKMKGKPLPDANLRDTENVPLAEDVEAYFKREVLPHAPDAWIDHEKTKVGYEIPFNRHFYMFEPPRDLALIDVDLEACTDRIKAMIHGLAA